MAQTLSVLIPCYNERHTLKESVRRVLAAPRRDLRLEVIVVDDASTDGSDRIAQDLARCHEEVAAVSHDRNLGKGAAIRTAQRHCTGDLVMIHDADLEYDPSCIPELVAPILDGRADVVYGSRFSGGGERRILYFWHSVGNRLLTLVSNMATDLNLSDMETCYKVFRGDHFRGIPLQSRRFGFEPEITAKIAKLDLRVYEVPITYHGRTYAAGKKISWRDGIAAIYTIAKYWIVDGLSGMDEGLETLQAIRRARRYNRYLCRRITPYVGDRVLEAGAGIGNLTVNLLTREVVIVADQDAGYIERLRRLFANNPNVRPVCMDLEDRHAYEDLLRERLDTVLCVNVLEHLDDDVGVLRSFHRALEPGGQAVILVPQGPALFGSIDRAIGHRRRYTRRELRQKLEDSGFDQVRIFGLNRVAAVGWWVNGRVLHRRTVSPLQMRLFDLISPLLPMLDRILPAPPLSLVAVGRCAGSRSPETENGDRGSAGRTR